MALAVALAASFWLTILVRRLALRVGMVDHPGPRKVHQTPIPLLGGLAIYCAVLLASVFAWQGATRAEIVAILTGGTLLAVVGILDDRGLLHHQIKLFVAMPAAALVLVASGIRVHVLSTLVPGAWGVGLDAALTVFWVVGITAAFSILDHMDGLCAGVAAVAAGFFALLALLSGQLLVSTLAAGVLGAALGFLCWNFSPAVIFMGDGGAMLLGFLLATLGILLRYPAPAFAVSWMVPVLVLGVPIFDTTLVSISRSRRGLIPFTSPGKDHAAHRLSNLGLGHRGAVLAMYGLGIFFGLVALLLTRVTLVPAVAICAFVAAGVLVAVALLERAPYERQQKKQQG
jgi:UDP-GlcNAc:undecaprenyl-phosphate GlcNAc-1-phosphate transferase